MDNDQEEIPTASVSMWILLILVAAASFWTQAVVTEERFVPALNLLSTIFKIPDDVAGATLMAAGASSPELFSSFVALFVTHSSLGLGTIVGSEIFNQLIICAGAVFSAKGDSLTLDKAIVLREVSFYALGIIVLYFALQDKRPVDWDTEDHIFISFYDACMVFVGYILYVWVCANMDTVVGLFSKAKSGEKDDALTTSITKSYGTSAHVNQTSIEVDEKLPFLHEKSILSNEPKGNFHYEVELYRTATGEVAGQKPGPEQERPENSVIGKTLRAISKFSDGATVRPFAFMLHVDKPSYHYGLYDVEVNNFEERMSCFMWQQSYFYNKARLATHGWHLRWFIFSSNRMYSVPNRIEFEKHKISYPIFEEINVDTSRLVIEAVHPEPGRPNFHFMCPSEEIFEKVVKKMAAMITLNQQNEDDGMMAPAESEVRSEEFGDTEESMIAFPADGSSLTMIMFVLLFPLRWLMHMTVPDVRTMDHHGVPKATAKNAWIAVGMCLVWLIVGSYAMVASLESLAALMNIPDAVVGVTVSAAGTSLPNYVASAVAARNGLGNCAVSNAFGSNTFNIMIGLGLPWVIYTSFGTHFQPYYGLRDEGIVESVVIMGSVCLLFLVFMIPSGFVLHKWHGWVFIFIYIAYLAYSIGKVYI